MTLLQAAEGEVLRVVPQAKENPLEPQQGASAARTPLVWAYLSYSGHRRI